MLRFYLKVPTIASLLPLKLEDLEKGVWCLYVATSSLTDFSTSSRRRKIAFGKILEEGWRWDS